MIEASVIIRTKNEERWIKENLKRLSEQTYKNFEVVIIDSGSTDRTLEIIDGFKDLLALKVLKIKSEDFSYPFALNFGIENSSAEKYIIILSGHSLPVSKAWIADGISDFTDEKIMGAYGFVWALPDGSIWEKLIFNEYLCKIRNIFKKQLAVKDSVMGVMGFTNAIIRKDLWKKRRLNEDYGLGGEDQEWAAYWIAAGYVAIRDIRFSVYHSHGLGLRRLMRQFEYWKSLDRPQPFKFPEFRDK